MVPGEGRSGGPHLPVPVTLVALFMIWEALFFSSALHTAMDQEMRQNNGPRPQNVWMMGESGLEFLRSVVVGYEI